MYGNNGFWASCCHQSSRGVGPIPALSGFGGKVLLVVVETSRCLLGKSFEVRDCGLCSGGGHVVRVGVRSYTDCSSPSLTSANQRWKFPMTFFLVLFIRLRIVYRCRMKCGESTEGLTISVPFTIRTVRAHLTVARRYLSHRLPVVWRALVRLTCMCAAGMHQLVTHPL